MPRAIGPSNPPQLCPAGTHRPPAPWRITAARSVTRPSQCWRAGNQTAVALPGAVVGHYPDVRAQQGMTTAQQTALSFRPAFRTTTGAPWPTATQLTAVVDPQALPSHSGRNDPVERGRYPAPAVTRFHSPQRASLPL